MVKKPARKKLDLTNLGDLSKAVPPSTSVTPELVKPAQETPNSSVQEPDKPADDAPEASVQEESPTPRRQFDRRPQRIEVKPIQILESATNEAGDVFQSGDKIIARSPWGAMATAEITTIYADNNGDAWAQYVPSIPSIPPDWSWLGGCARAARLVKA